MLADLPTHIGVLVRRNVSSHESEDRTALADRWIDAKVRISQDCNRTLRVRQSLPPSMLIEEFNMSFRTRIVTLLLLALPVAGSATAATYAIGKSGPDGARLFATLADFTREVRCVNGDDSIVLEGGKTHHGTLALAPCDASVRGTITIRSSSSNVPARIMPALNARDLGSAWKVARSDELPPGTPLRGGDAQDLFVLGPLPQPVSQLIVGDSVRGPAAAPDQGNGRAPRTMLLSAIQTQRQGCPSWKCLRSDDPSWAVQVRAIAGSPSVAWPQLVLRYSPWSFTRHRIAGADPGSGTLRINAATGATAIAEEREFVEPGFGALLLHGAGTLDQVDEWFYDAGSKRLFVVARRGVHPDELDEQLYIALRNPSGKDPTADAGLSFAPAGKARAPGLNLIIRQLDIVAAAGSAMRIHRVGHVEIAQNLIRSPAEHGIQAIEIGRLNVVDNEISDTGNNGILVRESSVLEIRGNRIRNAGHIGNQPQLTMQFNGIRAAGFTRADIRDNTIDGVGYAGIMLAERGAFEDAAAAPPQLVIAGNTITHFCQMLNDCGAVYINGGGKDLKKPAPVSPGIEKRIVNNRIADPEPNLQGLPAGLATPAEAGKRSGARVRMVGAVYLDHRASGYDIRGNSVQGLYTPYGWNVFNGGIENACSRQSAAQCKAGSKASHCYTQALFECNTVP
ncbi:MAG: right-handed parallel beta-helix repeat-containing protein [Gammaproteobacteria bacterium]|nr:right-handed parallel beta-helix repeat-containing protein [Gammaproteobacteria bacterium]